MIVYQSTLNENSTQLTQGYTYVVKIPASSISGGGESVKVTLRGPTTGQIRFQNIYIGHGTAPSFDGNQVQLSGAVTLGNETKSFTVPFTLDETKDLLIAYEILSGDYYRRNWSLSNHTLYWKVASESGQTTKTGYSSANNATASVEKIEVCDEGCEEPVNETNMNIETYVQNGEMHAGYAYDISADGKYIHFQLKNTTSDKHLMLFEVDITPESDSIMTLRSYTTTLSTAMGKCNLKFNGGGSEVTPHYSKETSLLGTVHSVHYLSKRTLIHPYILLTPGQSVIGVLHSQTGVKTLNMIWREYLP